MKSKILAIVVVIIVVVAAFAVYIYTSDDTNYDKGEKITGAIYGNVNGDSYIDEDDAKIIQRIIDGDDGFTLSDYPLADANNDGSVTDADLDIVNKAIAKETTTLYILDYDGVAQAVTYPLDKVTFTAGTNMLSVISVLGLGEEIDAISFDSSKISKYLHKSLYEAVEADKITILGDEQSLSTDALATMSQMGIKLCISDDTGQASDEESVITMKSLGIVYLRLNAKNPDNITDTVNTLGILFQKEDKAKKYVDWYNDVLEQTTSAIASATEKPTCLSAVMTNSVSGTSSDYYECTVLAGGNNIADWEDSTRKYNDGDTWLLDYNADYLFHFRTIAFDDGLSDSDITKYSGYFDDTSVYEKGGYYLLNGNIPMPLRIAFMSSVMYSNYFDENWFTNLFQEYITDIIGSDYDITKNVYYWCSADA